jgi:predicted ribosome quality control (RQC) complex YloA/Tae2 family protein
MEEFERIVSLRILSKGILYTLIIEIFGRGNILLVDEKMTILHALSYRRMRDRNILRGEHFQHPPSRGLNPLKVTQRQLMDLRDTKGTVIKSLTHLLSIDGVFAEEMLLRTSITKKRESNTLTNAELNRLYIELSNLAVILNNIPQPTIILDETGAFMNVLPFPLSIYNAHKIQTYPSFNEAVDEYFTRLSTEKKDEGTSNKVAERMKEQIRILHQQRRRLLELRTNIEKYQQIGDLVYSHTTQLQKLLHDITRERERGKPWDEIVSRFVKKRSKEDPTPFFVNSIDSKRGVVKLTIGTVAFEVSLRNSVYESASSFYNQVKEAKEKLKGLQRAIKETEKQIKTYEQTKIQVESERFKPVKIRKRLWFEKFHWVYSSEGLLIVGGRDATTNEILVKKHTTSKDLILHADIAGAPFVLIKVEETPPSETSILEAAQLAVAYSRAWREGLMSLDVYWVTPDQVSKEAPTGEYLSKGMFMIRGQRNYLRNIPLQISIGIIEKDDQLLIIGGAVSAIASQTQCAVSLVPGRKTSGGLAKEIRYNLSKKAPIKLREKILKLSIEEIQRFIPPGKSELL